MKNLYTLFFILLSFTTQAHLGSILGIVLDESNKLPLTNATIFLVCTKKVTQSDEFGRFTFQNIEPNNYQIEVSFIGYGKQKIDILVKENEPTLLNINLINSQIQLNEVVFKSSKNIIEQVISKIDINLRPIQNSQEILRLVPGLFIGQHAGGGKAEQIFLRGFDIDHGTDLCISADGMPVNMVSHAHGQGYADLHFVIPELVQKVDFKKGTYQADKGNFATAGWVDFQTKTAIEKSELKLEAGQFDSYRAVGIFNVLGEKAKNSGQNAYFATEYNFSNGYFENPQAFNRINIFGKYHGHIGNNNLLIASLSTFSSKWKASGQIPDRAVNAGQIGFFGAIDPNEGGNTDRSNINLQLVTNTRANNTLKNQLFFTNYNFKLFSNFTFFLRDSVNGDQIKQAENRNLLGYNGSYQFVNNWGAIQFNTVFGMNIRYDIIKDSELSHTKNKTDLLERIKYGNIAETNTAAYIDETIQLSPSLTLNAGLRLDYFKNKYADKLLDSTFVKDEVILLPKFNLYYIVNEQVQLVFNAGKGFHSNDSRVASKNTELRSLPAAFGTEIGANLKPFKKLFINTSLWYLAMKQEFVYVGDAGIVELSGRSLRYGIDFSARLQIIDKLFVDFDFNATAPSALDEENGLNYIPLAPRITSIGGFTYQNLNGFNGSVRYRYIGDRPANEDNSIVAKGYFVNDLQLNYSKPKYIFGLSIQNIFNERWKETQFATESRLQNEKQLVEEIHFTPGSPFFAKFSLSLNF